MANAWHFLKHKFIWVKQDATQREITRLTGLASDLFRGKNYGEARELLLRALQHESKIENPKLNRAEAYGNHGDQVSAVENYRLALSKKQPKLSSLKRIHVERVLDTLLG